MRNSSQPQPWIMEELKERLLAVHLREDCNQVIAWIDRDADRFRALLHFISGDDQKLAAKAAWPFPETAKLHPALASNALPTLIQLINQPEVHDAVKRGVLKWLTTAAIPETFHGRLMHLCFETAANAGEKPAAKAYSLHILGKLAVLYPDIRPELETLITEKSPLETPAFKSVARKLGKPGASSKPI